MRVAWVMKLKPGCEEIYKQKHDEIWPELVDLLRRQGVRNYSIYRYGLTLFAYLERDEPEPLGRPHDPIILRWWKMMEPYMEYNRRRHAVDRADRGSLPHGLRPAEQTRRRPHDRPASLHARRASRAPARSASPSTGGPGPWNAITDVAGGRRRLHDADRRRRPAGGRTGTGADRGHRDPAAPGREHARRRCSPASTARTAMAR